jgi:hypothetical protein
MPWPDTFFTDEYLHIQKTIGILEIVQGPVRISHIVPLLADAFRITDCHARQLMQAMIDKGLLTHHTGVIELA